MSENQDLFDVTIRALEGLKRILKTERPDLVLIQGDTTTTFIASLSSFYFKIPVGHVEAGLRTYNKFQPFPEEKNRHVTTVLADYHFAPTQRAKANLINENIREDKIWVTGNTGIDALLMVVNKQRTDKNKKHWQRYFKKKWNLRLTCDKDTNISRIILITGHRRESFGQGFESICHALKKIATTNPEVKLVYPVHLNPNVRKPVFEILGGNGKGSIENIFLIEPLEYEPFVYLMDRSFMILTDSGGIQEEAPSLGKPVLIMRDTTERPEAVEAGANKVVGLETDKIVMETQKLLDDEKTYEKMSSIKNPFGDGKAAFRIVKILEELLCQT